MMKRYLLLLFIIGLQNDILGQIQLREKGYIDIIYRSDRGDQAAFRDIKLHPDKIIELNGVGNYNMSHFVFFFKAWDLMGDLVLNPVLYWDLNKVILRGNTSGNEIAFEGLKKYPDLVKRYLAIQPLSIQIGIKLRLYDSDGEVKHILVKLQNSQIQYAGSGETQFPISPFSPVKWSDNIRMADWNTSATLALVDWSDFGMTGEGEKKIREVVSNAMKINGSQGFEMKIKWPDEAIEEIGKLYDEYEKGKKTPSPLEQVEAATKKKLPQYTVKDQWTEPFTDEGKVEVIKDQGKREIQLKKGNRILKTFDSRKYSITSLNEKVPFFVLMNYSNNYLKSLINNKGELQSIAGETEFEDITWNEENKFEFLKSQGGRTFLMEPCTGWDCDLGGFYNTSSEVQQIMQNCEAKWEQKRKKNQSEGKKGSEIVACRKLYGGDTKLITTDIKLTVLTTRSGYFVSTNSN